MNKYKDMGKHTKHTPERMKELIEEYFLKQEDKPTITGLVLACGYADPSTFYALEKREEFSDIIKEARQRVINAYEKRLHGTQCTGAIFALKNFGWKDTQDTKITVDPIKIVIELQNGKVPVQHDKEGKGEGDK